MIGTWYMVLFVSCIYHRMSVYIYYVHLPNACCAQHLLFPFPLCHTTLPHPPIFRCSWGSYSPYPCNSNPISTVYSISTKLVLSVSCIYHWMSVYILCTSTKCRLCTTTDR